MMLSSPNTSLPPPPTAVLRTSEQVNSTVLAASAVQASLPSPVALLPQRMLRSNVTRPPFATYAPSAEANTAPGAVPRVRHRASGRRW